MKKIERRAFVCLALALLLAAGLGFFLVKYFLDGGSWASSAFNRHLYNSSGQLASGTVLDRDGDVLSEVVDGQRTYYDNATVRKATLHAVGDLQGNIGTGALNAFADKLTGYSLLNGAFGAQRGNDLYLTIDARYNYTAYEALGGKSGTVAVYNYETGEILCMVSAPSYDPLNVPEDITTNDRYKGAYLNRFLSSTFTPGSVYKTVTLAAALEDIPDLADRTWTCSGSVQMGDETIICSGTHGEQDIASAFANSCNVAFAQIAQELGPGTLEKYTEQAGLTGSYSISGLPTAKGSFDFDNITDGQLGWAGVGQYHDQVNPAALMIYMGAIANGGKAAEPYLILRTESALGLPSLPHFTTRTGTLISADTAAALADPAFPTLSTGGSAIINSTPYGMGNFYHSTWVDAIAGGNPFNAIRLYWQMHPERDQSWYDQMASALGPKRTAQEIDGDFLSSGNTVFDMADIKAIEDCLSDYPVLKYRFNRQYRQFNEPDPNKQYFIGADVATGRGSDYSSFTCMDKLGEEQVVYKGRMAVDKYARLLGDTGQLFNFAVVAPESNDVGLAVTSALQSEGYPNLYYYQKLLKKKGKSRPEVDKSPGWLTTQKNRSVIIEGLEQDIREENIIVKDPFFVQEAPTFIYDGLGRPVAMGKHRNNTSAVDVDLEGDVYSDDDIFGKAICNHIRKGKTNVIIQPK